MCKDLEMKLEKAGEALGIAMQNAPAKEREILKGMYEKFTEFAKGDSGMPDQDVSALFAVGIVGNKYITSEEIINAATHYIDCDLEYCRSLRK